MDGLKYWFFVERDEEEPTMWNGWIPEVGGHSEGFATCASSLERLLDNAVELADLWVITCWEENREPVQGSVPQNKRTYQVTPSLPVRSAWLIRKLRQDAGLTQTQAAEQAKIKQQAYSRLENPSQSNATVKTLEKVAKDLGSRVSFSLEKSA